MTAKNLLAETLKIMAENGKGTGDVEFVMRAEHGWGNSRRQPISFSWAEFEALANFDYDDGHGGNEIEGSLKIVGSNWWLERGEYDGSEWWEFKTMPDQPEMRKPERADLLEG